MKKSTIVLIVILAVVAIAAFSMIGSYNGLAASREAVDSAWAGIETQLQRRTDLIPNLVETVKGYAAHEEEILTSLADARAKLAGASTPDEMAAADGELSSAISRLLVVVENYPDLKADQNFIALQDELAGTENRIAVARGDYNAAAETYNAKIRVFPTNVLAGMFGFERVEYFKAAEGASTPPVVSFD